MDESVVGSSPCSLKASIIKQGLHIERKGGPRPHTHSEVESTDTNILQVLAVLYGLCHLKGYSDSF